MNSNWTTSEYSFFFVIDDLLLRYFSFRYTTDFGNQVINKETRLPLACGFGKDWRLDGNLVALDEKSRIIDLRRGRAIDRGWTPHTTPGIYTPHDGPNQKWTLEVV